MNPDINHKTYITATDDSSRSSCEAVPPPAGVKIVVPEPSDVTPGIIQYGKTKSKGTGKLFGMSLAWRGVNLLGVALLVSVAWFIGAWVRHGRAPLGLSQPDCKVSPCFTPTKILPPTWLVVILGFMVLISIFMMVLGTQDFISNRESGEGEKIAR